MGISAKKKYPNLVGTALVQRDYQGACPRIPGLSGSILEGTKEKPQLKLRFFASLALQASP